MSRTWNTAPYSVMEQHFPSWRFHGYPALVGGAWPNRKEYAKQFWRSYRQRVRQALHHEREVPQVKRGVRWMVW